MNPEDINLQCKRIEESIVDISTKIADAIEIMQKSKIISTNLEDTLIEVQCELEELYNSLEKY